jgi:NDP-sugar pyrophosphorylase family protein
MIEVNGYPISKYTLDQWKKGGFNNFCFLIDDTQRGESIKKFYNDGKKFGANIRYSVEHGKLGSGGAFKLAIENGSIKNSFIYHQPDDVVFGYKNFPIDFFKIFLAALKDGYQMVDLCVPGTLYPFGEVIDENSEVKDFIEKPFVKKDTNVGVVGMSSEAFPLIKELDTNKGPVKIERTVFKTLARSGKMLKVLLPSEYWVAVNDDPSLKKFEEIISKR